MTLQARDGSAVSRVVELKNIGDGAVLRPDGTSVRPEASAAPVSSWCTQGERTSTATPSVITAPTLTGCGSAAGCTVTAGTWSNSPTISYVPDFCTSALGPGLDCLDATWMGEPSVFARATGCGYEWDVTVVASNSSGDVFYPLKQVVDSGCAQ